MARLVVLQQSQPSVHSPRVSPSSSLLPSSLSEFNVTGFNVSFQDRRNVCQPKGVFQVSASSAKKILVMGGTRFIGVFLSRLLVEEGHQVTLFTRGRLPSLSNCPENQNRRLRILIQSLASER